MLITNQKLNLADFAAKTCCFYFVNSIFTQKIIHLHKNSKTMNEVI